MSIGLRIRQARRRRGLSLRDLADRVQTVSHTTLGKYERGASAPNSAVLLDVADALGVDIDFFLRPVVIGEIRPAYRTKTDLSKGDEGRVIEEVRDWLERYLEAEKLSPAGEEAHFEYPDGFPRRVSSFEDVERAADDLRRAWEIGADPIVDLTAHLEDHDVKVGIVDAPDSFVACAFMAEVNGGVPVIATREGLSGDRQRFTLAHELAHLMLVVDEDEGERFVEERACHRFAGAFLAPRRTLLDDIGEHRQRLSIVELYLLKQKYGLSMQALIHRARDLGVISPSRMDSLYRMFDEKGWREEEPGEPVAAEHPNRFRILVLQALAERIIGPRRAAELYKGPLETERERAVLGRDALEPA